MGGCSSAPSAAAVQPRATTFVPAPVTPLARVLDENEAWAIAVAWCTQLQGCAVLVSDVERVPLSIIPSFEWVQFDFTVGNANPIEMAAYARAATITWFALSCCEGYSGTKNPQFWRRVFLEYRYPGYMIKLLHAAESSVSEELFLPESVRFFDKPDRPFPRVKIQSRPAGEDTVAGQIFLGRRKYQDKTLDKNLDGLVATLKPYIHPDQWTRCVPVCIGNVSVAKLETVLKNTAQRTAPAEIEPEPEETTATPRFRLVSVALLDDDALGSERLLTELRRYDVDIEVVCKRAIDETLFVIDLRRQSDENHTRWRIRSLRMHNSLRGDMKALFSALPRLQTVQNVDIGPALLVRQRPLVDWKWLGYAIFHPDTRSHSALVSLDLRFTEISRAAITAMQSMAVGNQLCEETDNMTSTTYIEGWIGAPTNVWVAPAVADASLQSILPPDRWVTLCVRSAETLAANPEWICIVNPGFGLGWIRRNALVEVRSRPPSKSCIRALRLHHAVDQELVLNLLEVLGDNLTSLEVVDSRSVSAEALHRILQRCPSLKSLCVCHDGTLWADPQLAMAVPCLEELQLQTASAAYRTVELKQLNAKCLPHLKALRVTSLGSKSFRHHQAIFKAFLAQQRVLHYLHVLRYPDSYDQISTNSYESPHREARDFHRLLKEKALDVSDQPFQKECLLAFLSVIRRVSMQENGCEPSPLRLFGSDIVQVISQFTTSSLRREITIDL